MKCDISFISYDKIPKDTLEEENKLLERAIALGNKKNFNVALIYLNNVLFLNPKNENALLNKGIILAELKLFDNAIACYDQVLKINPNNSIVLQKKELAINQLIRKNELD